MTKMSTLFVVTDIETTLKHRIAFDVAWKIIDRRGKEYGKGSYIVREAFRQDVPFFKEKLGFYFDDAYAHLIQPASIFEIRESYNDQIHALKEKGHRVIACAYNAAFDFKYLPETIQKIADNVSERWMKTRVELLDIWNYWGASVPLHYKANPTESGKYLSTSAESAYRFEFCKPDFEERHIAWHDVEIESEILIRALSRKKPMPVVQSPRDFVGGVWKAINTRLGIDGKTDLAAA
jgi:hypothetical protein